jgi:hypothetical protein
MVPRIIDKNPAHELAIITMMVYSLPCPLDKVDTLVVFPGMGEDWRVIQAIEICNQYTNIKRLLIAGVNKTEKTYTKLTIKILQNLPNPPRSGLELIFQDKAGQTNHQADWVAKEAISRSFSVIGLLTSPYHLIRAYCTLVGSFKKLNLSYIPILPISATVSPDTVTPETSVDAWRMAMGEYERIGKYQDLGDVASYADIQEYINWLWKSGLFK